MKKIILLCMALIVISSSVSAATYSVDFKDITAGADYKQGIIISKQGDFSWNLNGNTSVIHDGDDGYLVSGEDMNIYIPEKARKIFVKARMRSQDFTENKFPLCFRGGPVSDRSAKIGYALVKSNAWDGGLGIIPGNSTTEYNPDTSLLYVGWGQELKENDNNVYIYKDEWFYAGISYDYADETLKAYYSYDGDKYYEVYSKQIEPIVNNERTAIRSILTSKNLHYSDLFVECDTDYIYGIKIKNSKGEEIERLTDETEFSVQGSAYDPYEEMNSLTTISAVYDKATDKLLEVKFGKDPNLTDKKNLSLGSFELQHNVENVKVKLLAVDGTNSMKPYCKPIILK